MGSGARNLHRLAGVLRRLEHEAATGSCAMCGRPSVGFIESWDLHPRGICAEHVPGAQRHGYVVHPDPFEVAT